ncbi:MAG: hypothetical protein ACOYKM_07775 [Caulobacterales bacterium]
MARAQAILGGKTLPTFFSGHEADGTPARSGSHRHLAYAFDGPRSRLLVIAPHVLSPRSPSEPDSKNIELLGRVLVDFADLRAGPAGRLSLAPAFETTDDPLLGPNKEWMSLTPYRANLHFRRANASAALAADLRRSLVESGLPTPGVAIEAVSASNGLEAQARLQFPVPVEGLMLFGRTRHFGGGLFCPVPRT